MRARGASLGVLLSVLALSAPGAAAQSILGTVVEAGVGGPLPGVLVSLLRPDGSRVRGVLTDDSGRFSIEAPLGRYSLRAERIGLQATTTEAFDLDSFRPLERTIRMTGRPVSISGIVVDTRVQSCRLDREKAGRVQRWWSEIRTALDVSAALQEEQIGLFLVEDFRREWDEDAEDLLGSNGSIRIRETSRPFTAVPAEELMRDGFVQGSYGPGRLYLGPDAEVILSSSFLSQHCFSMVEDGDREHQVGLRFEPVQGRRIADIHGTLWIDTTTAELRDLDFRFVNLDGPDDDEAGGRIVFEHLSSGAWIVSEWYIRTPLTGVRGRRGRLVTTGFFDGGATVTPLAPSLPGAPVGSIHGVVTDRLRGGVLSGATVTLLGTERTATTDEEGRFWLFEVPAGTRYLAFSHPDVEPWGLGTGFVAVDVEGGESVATAMHIPNFAEVARALCLGAGVDANTTIVGRLLGPEREPLPGQSVQLVYEHRSRGGGNLVRLQARTDDAGRFAVCSVPEDVSVTMQVRLGGSWEDVTHFVPSREGVTYREVWFSGR